MLHNKTIIGRQLIILLLTISLFGCADKNKETDRVFIKLNEGLISSNKLFADENSNLYGKINENLLNPIFREKASVWQPKAIVIRDYSKYVNNLIDSIINLLEGQEIFVNEINSNKLFDSLFKYQNLLLTVDPEMNNNFKNKINIILLPNESFNIIRTNFYETYFLKKSKIATIALLNNLKSSIVQTENKLISYCFYKTKMFREGYDNFSVIVGQSTNIAEQGDEIFISAGIGAFSRVASAKIYIEGKQIALNENAVAVYKFKAIGNPGKYSVPVKINYINVDGKEKSENVNIDYKIKK